MIWFYPERPARRTRPKGGTVRRPVIRFSGFEGEGANQGDVSRPERSGGRVTATEKKMIARGRLSPTKEVTGGRRATLAQESGASAGLCGRGAGCKKPEDRQSELSEVCRDLAKEKYKMPEGRSEARPRRTMAPAREGGG